jgi:hypothetical protein
MSVIPLALLLLAAAPQLPDKTPDLASQQTLEQGRKRYEAYRQASIQIDELAGSIHSEADARAFVDAVAEQLTEHRHLFWTALSIRHRVARAEYAAVSDPSRRIPEQRIADVWNEYVREIDAPEEALVTVVELHNLRDGMYYSNQISWKKQHQSLWTMPDVNAVDEDGKVANGCRAVEALKIIYQLHEFYQNLLSARERVKKGVLISDLAAQRQREQSTDSQPKPVVRAELRVVANQNPVRLAANRYQQEHGEDADQQLLKRLFNELFPKE